MMHSPLCTHESTPSRRLPFVNVTNVYSSSGLKVDHPSPDMASPQSDTHGGSATRHRKTNLAYAHAHIMSEMDSYTPLCSVSLHTPFKPSSVDGQQRMPVNSKNGVMMMSNSSSSSPPAHMPQRQQAAPSLLPCGTTTQSQSCLPSNAIAPTCLTALGKEVNNTRSATVKRSSTDLCLTPGHNAHTSTRTQRMPDSSQALIQPLVQPQLCSPYGLGRGVQESSDSSLVAESSQVQRIRHSGVVLFARGSTASCLDSINSSGSIAGCVVNTNTTNCRNNNDWSEDVAMQSICRGSYLTPITRRHSLPREHMTTTTLSGKRSTAEDSAVLQFTTSDVALLSAAETPSKERGTTARRFQLAMDEMLSGCVFASSGARSDCESDGKRVAAAAGDHKEDRQFGHGYLDSEYNDENKESMHMNICSHAMDRRNTHDEEECVERSCAMSLFATGAAETMPDERTRAGVAVSRVECVPHASSCMPERSHAVHAGFVYEDLCGNASDTPNRTTAGLTAAVMSLLDEDSFSYLMPHSVLEVNDGDGNNGSRVGAMHTDENTRKTNARPAREEEEKYDAIASVPCYDVPQAQVLQFMTKTGTACFEDSIHYDTRSLHDMHACKAPTSLREGGMSDEFSYAAMSRQGHKQHIDHAMLENVAKKDCGRLDFRSAAVNMLLQKLSVMPQSKRSSINNNFNDDEECGTRVMSETNVDLGFNKDEHNTSNEKECSTIKYTSNMGNCYCVNYNNNNNNNNNSSSSSSNNHNNSSQPSCCSVSRENDETSVDDSRAPLLSAPPRKRRSHYVSNVKAAAGSLIAVGGRRVPVDKLYLLRDTTTPLHNLSNSTNAHGQTCESRAYGVDVKSAVSGNHEYHHASHQSANNSTHSSVSTFHHNNGNNTNIYTNSCSSEHVCNSTMYDKGDGLYKYTNSISNSNSNNNASHLGASRQAPERSGKAGDEHAGPSVRRAPIASVHTVIKSTHKIKEAVIAVNDCISQGNVGGGAAYYKSKSSASSAGAGTASSSSAAMGVFASYSVRTTNYPPATMTMEGLSSMPRRQCTWGDASATPRSIPLHHVDMTSEGAQAAEEAPLSVAPPRNQTAISNPPIYTELPNHTTSNMCMSYNCYPGIVHANNKSAAETARVKPSSRPVPTKTIHAAVVTPSMHDRASGALRYANSTCTIIR